VRTVFALATVAFALATVVLFATCRSKYNN